MSQETSSRYSERTNWPVADGCTLFWPFCPWITMLSLLAVLSLSTYPGCAPPKFWVRSTSCFMTVCPELSFSVRFLRTFA